MYLCNWAKNCFLVNGQSRTLLAYFYGIPSNFLTDCCIHHVYLLKCLSIYCVLEKSSFNFVYIWPATRGHLTMLFVS